MIRITRSVSLLLACWCGTATAQQTTGDIRGRLRASTGPIAGAQITAIGPTLIGARVARSATDGVFQLLALPPGTYSVRVAALGYRSVTVQDVSVRLGATTGLAIPELQPAATQLDEVRVAAPSLTLDPARTTVGGTLDKADLAALPGGRDYTSAIAILPHLNTSYHGDPVNSAGSTRLENMLFIDGVNVTTPFRATEATEDPSSARSTLMATFRPWRRSRATYTTAIPPAPTSLSIV